MPGRGCRSDPHARARRTGSRTKLQPVCCGEVELLDSARHAHEDVFALARGGDAFAGKGEVWSNRVCFVCDPIHCSFGGPQRLGIKDQVAAWNGQAASQTSDGSMVGLRREKPTKGEAICLQSTSQPLGGLPLVMRQTAADVCRNEYESAHSMHLPALYVCDGRI